MHIRRTIQRDIISGVLAIVDGTAAYRVVFVTGEAGIGKSTLLADVRTEFEESGRQIVIARAECSTPVAGQDVGEVESLKPFADIMANLVERASSPDGKRPSGFKLDIGKFLVDTAPSWIGLIPVIGTPISHALNIVSSGYDQFYLHGKVKSEASKLAASQEQVFRQYTNFLRGIAVATPVVLMIDDFHWADTSSTNLLFNLARDLHDLPVAFVVAYREDDARDARSNEGHPIVRIRHELERYDLALGFDVPKVDVSEIHTLLAERFPEYRGGTPLEAWLDHHCGGNLLFVTQFLTTLVDNGFLEDRSARILKDLDHVRVPSSAFAVVQERLRRMSADEKEILRYASVEGETFTVSIVSSLVELNALKTLQRLRLIEEQHQVIRSLGKQEIYAEETTSFQFIHVLLQQALYQDLEAEEREILHGMIVDQLEKQLVVAQERNKNVHSVSVRFAVHAGVLKRFARGSEVLYVGARSVWRQYAVEETLHLLRLALYGIRRARIVEHVDPVESEVNVLMLQGEVYTHAGQPGKASACFMGAMACADGHDGSDTVAKLGVDAALGASNVAWRLARYDEAMRWAEIGLARAQALAYHEGETRALRLIGNVHYRLGALDDAFSMYSESKALAIRTGDRSSEAASTANMGNVLSVKGKAKEALEQYTFALHVRRELGDIPGTARELMNIGEQLRKLGDKEQALASLEEALTLCRSTGDVMLEGQVLNNMATVAQALLRFDEAIMLAKRSLAIKKRGRDVEGEARSWGTLGSLYKFSGDLPGSIEAFRTCAMIARSIGASLLEGKAYYGMGMGLFAMNEYVDALACLQLAHDLLHENRSHEAYDALLAMATISMIGSGRDAEEREAAAYRYMRQAEALARSLPELDAEFENMRSDWRETLETRGIVPTIFQQAGE